jgi:hypothetical protein
MGEEAKRTGEKAMRRQLELNTAAMLKKCQMRVSNPAVSRSYTFSTTGSQGVEKARRERDRKWCRDQVTVHRYSRCGESEKGARQKVVQRSSDGPQVFKGERDRRCRPDTSRALI